MKPIAMNGEQSIAIGLVEDNREDAKFFEQLLKDCRAFRIKRFERFSTSHACLERLLTYNADIDVLLIDYCAGDGLTSVAAFIRQIKSGERTKKIRVIVLTNNDHSAQSIIEALAAGATAFLNKQSDKFALESIIRDAYHDAWLTYTSAFTELIEYLKDDYRDKTKPFPNAPALTGLEREIIKKIAEGKTNEEIVEELKPTHHKYFDCATQSLRVFSKESLRRHLLPHIYERFGIETDNNPQSRAKLVAKALRCGVIRTDELRI
jgi:DNA-binding NarL/FixJ family response regulator